VKHKKLSSFSIREINEKCIFAGKASLRVKKEKKMFFLKENSKMHENQFRMRNS
jgi:hypothetical protein